MSIEAITKALRQAVVDANLGIYTTYENRETGDRPSGQMWASVVNFPADNYVATLGDNGEDNVTGFLQITLFTPEGQGTYTALRKVDQLLTHFKNGRVFSSGDQHVKIRRSQLTPLRPDSSMAGSSTTVSIFWDSRKQR